MSGASICAEMTANFKILREWQTPAKLKQPVLNLWQLDCINWNAGDVVFAAFHVQFCRAFSASISNVNISFCTIRIIFDRLLERVAYFMLYYVTMILHAYSRCYIAPGYIAHRSAI